MEAFTDGLWHYVSVDIVASQGPAVGRVNVTVDGRPDVSNRKLTFTSASEFLIGGMFVSKGVDERRLVLFTVVSFFMPQPKTRLGWRKATTRDEWRHIVNTATLQWSAL